MEKMYAQCQVMGSTEDIFKLLQLITLLNLMEQLLGVASAQHLTLHSLLIPVLDQRMLLIQVSAMAAAAMAAMAAVAAVAAVKATTKRTHPSITKMVPSNQQPMLVSFSQCLQHVSLSTKLLMSSLPIFGSSLSGSETIIHSKKQILSDI